MEGGRSEGGGRGKWLEEGRGRRGGGVEERGKMSVFHDRASVVWRG